MKKIFLLLTAMILSTGLWAESVRFQTNRYYHDVSNSWNLQSAIADLRNDYAVQSNAYVKIDVGYPAIYHTFVNLPTIGDVDDPSSGRKDRQIWFNTSQVNVTLLDDHAQIESITVSYATNIRNIGILIHFDEATFSMDFPAGETSHQFSFEQGSLCLNSITVNYRINQIDNVPYIDEDGNSQTQDNVTLIESSSERLTLDGGWYVVNGDVSLTKGADCNGDVHLILADGATLTSKGAEYGDNGYIRVSGTGNSLTIYGQEGQTGKLIARGRNSCAGIGGNSNTEGSNITINGGIIEAHGGKYAAGIGGGESAGCSNITINGGNVTATGGSYSAGIGGGNHGGATNIRINGGIVTANGGADTSGDGNIFPGIGAGFGGTASGIYVDGSLLLKADNTNPPTTAIAHTSTEDVAAALAGKRYATIEPGVIVTTHYAADKSANYGTYYNGMHAYEVVTEGVTLYTASLETVGSDTYLNLHAIEGNILPAATAVVVRSETEEIVTMVEYNNSTTDIDVSSNVLQGVDVATATGALGAGSLYILSAQVLSGDAAATTAFYRYKGETMAAHKAFLQIAPGQQAPTRIVWGDSPIVTGVEPLVSGKGQGASDKVLRNGQLYIIKSGHVYTAQGMLVE